MMLIQVTLFEDQKENDKISFLLIMVDKHRTSYIIGTFWYSTTFRMPRIPQRFPQGFKLLILLMRVQPIYKSLLMSYDHF